MNLNKINSIVVGSATLLLMLTSPTASFAITCEDAFRTVDYKKLIQNADLLINILSSESIVSSALNLSPQTNSGSGLSYSVRTNGRIQADPRAPAQGFATLLATSQKIYDGGDYWAGITISIVSSATASPTRFDAWTYNQYVEGVKSWSHEEIVEFRKWEMTQKEEASFNFNPRQPKSMTTDAFGNTLISYSEQHTSAVPLAIRTMTFTIGANGKLSSVLLTNEFVRQNILTDSIKTDLRIVISDQ